MNKLFLPNKKISKDPDNPNINVYKVEAILLIFQFWVPTWHIKKVITVVGLEDSTLRGLANTFLCQILLLAAI